MNTLNKKIIRRQQSKNDIYLTINNLSPSKKKLLKLKAQLKSEERTKDRAKIKVRALKNIVLKC